jgi:hypothetical protein
MREPAAWLTRTVTRLCLDQIKSARSRRETYVGAWLPDPLVGIFEPEEDEAQDDLTLTLMMALERLSPLERAAFLLHDVFGVAFDEVGRTLDRDPTAVRQLAVARPQTRSGRPPRFPVAREEGDRIAQAFFAASRDGDLKALGAMLAEGAVLYADGGGKATPSTSRSGAWTASCASSPACTANTARGPSSSCDRCGSTACRATSATNADGAPDHGPGCPRRPHRRHLHHPQSGQAASAPP